jgi:hypothetical protein
MARNKTRLVTSADFSGGLNLRANPFQLASNESPDMMNVDLDPRGGIRRREGIGTWGTEVSGTPRNIINHVAAGGAINQVLVYTGSTLRLYDPNTQSWSTVKSSLSGTRATWASINGKTYIQDGSSQPVRWNGTTATSLTSNWNNDLDAPNGGDMPRAKCITTLGDSNGYLFIGNTVEDNKPFGSRVRFSFPSGVDGNFGPEDWRDCDFVDLDPDSGGDEITAMIPYSDRIVVFKRNSIWGLLGSPPNQLYPIKMANNIGAVSSDAVVVDADGIFFFSWPEGVYRLGSDGSNSSLEWLFEPLMPLIDEGIINASARDKISLGYHNKRLYVSVPIGTSTTNNRTYVCDMSSGQAVWSVHSYGVGDMYERQTTGKTELLGCSPDTSHILNLTAGRNTDLVGATETPIAAYYQTRWFADTSPFTTKRWRRPEYVAKVGRDSDVITVSVFHDLETTASRTHIIAPGQTDLAYVHGDLVGKAKCVSLRFDGPAAGDRLWEVNGFTLKAHNPRVEL